MGSWPQVELPWAGGHVIDQERGRGRGHGELHLRHAMPELLGAAGGLLLGGRLEAVEGEDALVDEQGLTVLPGQLPGGRQLEQDERVRVDVSGVLQLRDGLGVAAVILLVHGAPEQVAGQRLVLGGDGRIGAARGRAAGGRRAGRGGRGGGRGGRGRGGGRGARGGLGLWAGAAER